MHLKIMYLNDETAERLLERHLSLVADISALQFKGPTIVSLLYLQAQHYVFLVT